MINFETKKNDNLIGVLETTKWSCETPNNYYILSFDRSKLYSYRGRDKKEWINYEVPLKFNAKGRSFQVLVP